MSKKETVKSGMMKRHGDMFGFRHSYKKELFGDYEVNGTEEVLVNGKVLKKSCVKTVHPQDRFKGLDAVDFALENVIAAGALDSLKEGYFGSVTASELSDGMEATIDNAINAVNEAEAAASQNDGGNE